MNLYQVAEEISRRLANIFLKDKDGRRPVYGGTRKFQEDPHWRDCLLFYEYFHGDNGAGLGASHQTGWTGVIARLDAPVCDHEAGSDSGRRQEGLFRGASQTGDPSSDGDSLSSPRAIPAARLPNGSASAPAFDARFCPGSMGLDQSWYDNFRTSPVVPERRIGLPLLIAHHRASERPPRIITFHFGRHFFEPDRRAFDRGPARICDERD